MTVLTMPTSSDTIACVNCSHEVTTSEEIASYPSVTCPQCGEKWTGTESRSTSIVVTAPEAIRGFS